jgi:hypothetical protein
MEDPVLPELDPKSVASVPEHAHEQRALRGTRRERRRSRHVHLLELEPNQAPREPRVQQSVGLGVDFDHDIETARASRGPAHSRSDRKQAKEND